MSRTIVTQIGSLPYNDIGAAVDYSLRHDIPFLPELSRKGDSMLNYIQNPGQLSCLDEFKTHRFETVKIQCVGPATLILSGYNEDEAVERAYLHISRIMEGLHAQKVILFLDEPALGQVSFNYKELWAPLFDSFDVTSGVHVCGNMDWDQLFDSNIDIVSFDANQYDITQYPKYSARKKIAWGIESIDDIMDFQKGDFLTLPCGMSHLKYNINDCEKNLEKLIRISRKMY